MDFKLDTFEGPLDLLLRLIQRSEIDIYDIPISKLTAQYLEVVAKFPPNMEQLSEFLVMAATLLEIKSRMLLPRPKTQGNGNENEEPEDPREALVRKLLAYQHAQAIAKELSNLTPVGDRITGTGDRDLIKQIQSTAKDYQPVMDLISLSELMEIFTDVMARRESRRDTIRAGYGEMPRERFTLTEKVQYMRQILNKNGELKLQALFLLCQSKDEMVVTFLAVLEMVRRGMARANQVSSFAEVDVILV